MAAASNSEEEVEEEVEAIEEEGLKPLLTEMINMSAVTENQEEMIVAAKIDLKLQEEAKGIEEELSKIETEIIGEVVEVEEVSLNKKKVV